MWNGEPASRPRDSKPEDYWYTDIEEYFYNSDKIMMKNKVVFGINLLRHLPRAIEYANHRHDPEYQANLVKQEELENKRPEGTSRYTDAIVAEKAERYNINGRIVSKNEYEKHILEKLTKTVDYNLDEEKPKQDDTIKTKPNKPKTPLKNRMKQLVRK